MQASRRLLVLILSLLFALLMISTIRNIFSSHPPEAVHYDVNNAPTSSSKAPYRENDLLGPAHDLLSESTSKESSTPSKFTQQTLHGKAIAPKLGNETAKAELGRASWRLFHTMFARFPETPTKDERDALESWILLFARLYPCGECATHFQQILETYPPQVSSRNVVAAWGCHVHNVVNKSLGKEDFDCRNIGDFYDCGCADDETDAEHGGKTT